MAHGSGKKKDYTEVCFSTIIQWFWKGYYGIKMSQSVYNSNINIEYVRNCELMFEIQPGEFLSILQRVHLPTLVWNFAGCVYLKSGVEEYSNNVLSD
jgi:hypothetical protein